MIWVHLAMAVGQLVVGGLILRWGDVWDRCATGVFLAVAWFGLVASYFQAPNILQIAFWMAVILFLSLWLIAEKAQRWWMIGMAGFQLMSLMSFLAPVSSWPRLREVFVLFHWMLGWLCLACLALALLEIHWARAADGSGLEGRNPAQPDPEMGGQSY